MEQPLVSYIIVTYKRVDCLKKAIDSVFFQEYSNKEFIVVHNGLPEPEIDEVIKLYIKNENFRFFNLNENRGVAGGRNEGIKRASGEILIFLDDDAVFINKNSTFNIVSKFHKNRDLGVIAFKSINFVTGLIDKEEFPHRDKSLDMNQEFETSYYIGVGHAITKSLIQKIGFYNELLNPYAFEELDYSFRAIDNGFRIIYYPEIEIYHCKHQSGRLDLNKKWEKMLENRIKVSLLNLPYKYVLISSFCWIVKILCKVKFNLSIIFHVARSLLNDKRNILKQRKVLKKNTIYKLKKLKARLCY